MDRSDITLERMRSFVRVAERGSLSAVARELGIGQSTITRHLRELEDAVGVPLLSRTTRRVTMTDEGSRYYANCIQILRMVEQAGDEARGTRGQPAGTIRISCTAAIGVLHISRLIFGFQDRYPDIAIDLSLTDERVDLVREGVDIALRLGPLTDSSMNSARSANPGACWWLRPLISLRAGYLPSRRISRSTRASGCRISQAVTCWTWRDRAASAMWCRLAESFASTTVWPRARQWLPVAASRQRIDG